MKKNFFEQLQKNKKTEMNKIQGKKITENLHCVLGGADLRSSYAFCLVPCGAQL
jgi:hypothetical protein